MFTIKQLVAQLSKKEVAIAVLLGAGCVASNIVCSYAPPKIVAPVASYAPPKIVAPQTSYAPPKIVAPVK